MRRWPSPKWAGELIGCAIVGAAVGAIGGSVWTMGEGDVSPYSLVGLGIGIGIGLMRPDK